MSERSTPSDPVPSALPSRWARAVAVFSILLGGLCGGLIGFAFADIQCRGDCTSWKGLGIVVGALATAAGVSIVAILTLRAMDEWETIKVRDAALLSKDAALLSKKESP